MGFLPEHIEDLWKDNLDAYRALELVGDRLKLVAVQLRETKGDMVKYGPLDREYNQIHREWDTAFALFMKTNERFREATARVADEHEGASRRLRESRPPS